MSGISNGVYKLVFSFLALSNQQVRHWETILATSLPKKANKAYLLLELQFYLYQNVQLNLLCNSQTRNSLSEGQEMHNLTPLKKMTIPNEKVGMNFIKMI